MLIMSPVYKEYYLMKMHRKFKKNLMLIPLYPLQTGEVMRISQRILIVCPVCLH